MAGASEWFGGRPVGNISPYGPRGNAHGVRVRLPGDRKNFGFRKYGGEEQARAAAEKWRNERSLASSNTKNLVRKHPDIKGCLVMNLTVGYEVLIDEEDHDDLSNFTWSAHKRGSGIMYAKTRGDGNVTVSMHRHLCNPGPGKETDHIDGDGLNNQRTNLRSVTSRQNRNNMRMNSRNTSGENGISWDRGYGSWQFAWKECGKVKYKRFPVRPRGNEELKGVEKRKAVAYRDVVYRRIGNTNGLRPKK